ncbi:MAG TPA: FHA domain-containing protein, partial [Candidatus Thermoplasmatota archaeon]|nr:FHA domain-containing protein [Candidatus Thermoplasmatota archaeon]
LAESLRALGYPTRLELLHRLRFPRALSEIRLAPLRVAPGENAERAAAKQTVQAHLDKLVEADLVRVETVEQDGRATPRYQVNPPKLYALTEELRRVCVLYAGRGADDDVTGTMGAPAPAEEAEGPRLVLVHGAYEGRSFPLDDAHGKDGRWVIGRSRAVAVSLDYDPYVSLENTLVARARDGFSVVDLRESKNGTLVNWRPLAKDAPRRLRPGDVIGVGRSLLSFVPA